MNKEIIIIKQLPIIEQQLQAIKTEVTAKVKMALSLVCTEDTVKEVTKLSVHPNVENVIFISNVYSTQCIYATL